MPTTKASPHQVLKATGAPEVCLRSAQMKFWWNEKNDQLCMYYTYFKVRMFPRYLKYAYLNKNFQ